MAEAKAEVKMEQDANLVAETELGQAVIEETLAAEDAVLNESVPEDSDTVIESSGKPVDILKEEQMADLEARATAEAEAVARPGAVADAKLERRLAAAVKKLEREGASPKEISAMREKHLRVMERVIMDRMAEEDPDSPYSETVQDWDEKRKTNEEVAEDNNNTSDSK